MPQPSWIITGHGYELLAGLSQRPRASAALYLTLFRYCPDTGALEAVHPLSHLVSAWAERTGPHSVLLHPIDIRSVTWEDIWYNGTVFIGYFTHPAPSFEHLVAELDRDISVAGHDSVTLQLA